MLYHVGSVRGDFPDHVEAACRDAEISCERPSVEIARIEAHLRQYGVNTEEITFEQLFHLEEVQTFQDLFAAATGVGSIITRPDGTPITKPSNFCRLCRDIIRKTKAGCRNCYASDAAIGKTHPDGFIIQPCLSGGLWDAGCQIIVAGRHIATWLIGQVRNEAQTEDGMRRYAREIGANEDEVVRAFLEVPVMSLQKLEQLTRMVSTFANQLSLIAYQNISLSRIISAREKSEQSLREQEERLRMIGNSIPSGMLYEAEATPEGNAKFLYISEGVKLLHGCTPEEAMADAGFIYRTIHPDDIEELHRQERVATTSNGVFDNEFRARGPDGTWRWRHSRSSSHLLPDGHRVWVGIETDITAHKAAEESTRTLEQKLHQASKLEALGQLAGGIAHDLNNLLTPILGYGVMIRERLSQNETDLGQDIGLIIDAAERSSRLVRQLLIFARKQAIEIKPVDFNEAIIAFEPMLRRMLRENIEVSFHLSPGVGAILGDPGQLQQILINLAVNAQDAMPQGGRLIIETNRVQLDDAFLRLHGGEIAGPHAVLCVSDTGIGMDRETQLKIYDPFFTTKGPGKGTGLGLATVYGIVKRHSGYIHVYSEPGHGTTFRLYFPLTDLPFEALQAQPEAVSTKGGETILVVEDQDIVRTMVREILLRSGYAVLAASSGEEALQLFSDAKHGIKLLLSDVIMTGMNGPELYQRMSEKHPGMKGLFMSGYSSEILNHEGVLRGGCHIIQKPFAPRDLLRQLREILDRGNETGSASMT